jgi:hypothetical protein
MRLLYSLVCLLMLGVFLSGCKTQSTTTSSSQDRYSEDLSALRPKIGAPEEKAPEKTDDKKATTYVEPKHAVNKQLDAVLDSIDRINVSRKAIDGFTIQVYSGKREEALNAKKTLTTSLPDLDAEVQFTEPIFRVKVGKYFTRMEAQQDYSAVRRYFPAAIIVPERIATK